ncbi:MAG: DHH family phosphoesterase [Bacillota bacterium]|nr:DHH family phosphoesterase [Bacillota bacterium]
METAGGAGPIADLARRLGGRTVWVITHEAPDGDAIGSVLAMSHLVRACGGDAVPLCADPVPAVYAFLPRSAEIKTAPPDRQVPAARIYVDCATGERAGPLYVAPAPGVREINIDHHPSNTRFALLNWVDPESSSTGEMVAHLYDLLGVGLAGAAEALYAAVVTDTGSFAFESTVPATHRLAARLLEAGVSPGQFHSRIYESREPAALVLLGRALRTLGYSAGGRIAHMVLTPQDFACAGARGEHTDGIVNYARTVRGVEVGLLFFALGADQVRVAIRTRTGVDASALAARFGGGGHPRAAGCRLPPPLDDAVQRVLAAAGEALR